MRFPFQLNRDDGRVLLEISYHGNSVRISLGKKYSAHIPKIFDDFDGWASPSNFMIQNLFGVPLYMDIWIHEWCNATGVY